MTTEDVALGIGVIALVLSVVAIGFIYMNQPEEVNVDLSGIAQNKVSITVIQNALNNLKTTVNNLDIPYISKSDLDDLEDYASDFEQIDDNERDINELEGRVTILEDAPALPGPKGDTGAEGPEGPKGDIGEQGEGIDGIINCAETKNTYTKFRNCVIALGTV